MAIYIYALRDPKGEVRYIGKTNDPEKRLRKHISGARTRKENHHNANWIRTLLAVGQQPTMEVLYSVAPHETWQEVEKYFIDAYRAMGFNLTNILEGGGAEFDVSPAAVAARAAKAKITRATPEYRAKIGKISSESWADPGRRAARLEAMAKARSKPGHYEKRVAAGKEVASRPEVIQARSARMKEKYKGSPLDTLRFSEHFVSRRMEGIARRWSDSNEKRKARTLLLTPEMQSVIQAAAHTPEAKAKRAAKMAVIQSNPEYLANQSAKTKANWANPEFKAKMEAKRKALYERTHTPEHLEMMRDRRNAKKREKRASEDPVVREERLAARRAKRQAEKAAKLAESNS